MTGAQREHPEARAELRAAANWYEDALVGQRLLDATRDARGLIEDSPNAWPPIRDWAREPTVRRKGVPGFPYGIIYYVVDGLIVIVAYAHDSGAPTYWQSRLDS